MFTFVINYEKEIDFFGMTSLYFYKYFQEKKIKIINVIDKESEKQGEENRVVKKNLFNEIKFHVHNNQIREFQIIFIQSLFQENRAEFGGNITNRYEGIEKNLLEKLAEEKIRPEKINFINIDKLERDFKHIAREIEPAVGEELDKYGYTKIPSFSYDEIEKISQIWEKRMLDIKDVQFSKTNPETMSFEERELLEPLKEVINIVDEMIKEKIELIENSDLGKIDDSSIKKHISVYRMINKYFSDNLKSEFRRIDDNF
ncbi:MAG: hypothetical protein ACRCZH_02975, partial [Cetobacterium sp.]